MMFTTRTPKTVAIPLVGIFLILLIQGLSTGASFLIPVTSAILAYFVLSRPRRFLSQHGVPNGLVALAFTLLILMLVTGGLIYFAEPVSDLVKRLPWLVRDVQAQIGSMSDSPIRAVAEAADAMNAVMETTEEDGEKTMQVEVVDEEKASRQILFLAPRVLSQVLFAVLFLYFLLASGDFFLHRMIESLDRVEDKSRALEVVETIERRLGQYLGAITVINAGLGLCVGALMYLWGLENYLVVGVMAFALNFVPYLGGLVGTCIAVLLGFSQGVSFWVLAGIGGSYAAATALEGQLITPSLVSRQMQLNAPILFVVVAFFAYIWSIIGMIVAVPILIVIKIFCDEIAPLRNLGHFLGGAEAEDADVEELAAMQNIAPEEQQPAPTPR
jgi:predicted PurR-regulated permease PerM